MKIYLTNLRKYNEGELFGEWVTLPMDVEELEEKMNELLYNEEIQENDECFITDYECEYLDIEEYDNVFELNELAEQVEDLDETEIELIKVYQDNISNNIREAIDEVTSGNYTTFNDYEDYFSEIYCDVYKELEKHHLTYYFDFESCFNDSNAEIYELESGGYVEFYR